MVAEDAGSYVARLGAAWSTDHGDARLARRRGSLASIDLSGFTRLSERLARRDAAGAEELNATISAQFEPLIEIALDHAGDVLQFGGDALLIWFEGPMHERRAAASAWAMQRSLAAHGRVDTPAGPVRLRMSVGIASGQVTFAVIGTTHRELLVLGSCATRTVALEGRAAAGQVLLDEHTAAALAAGEVRDIGDGAWRLRRTVDAPTGAPLRIVDPLAAITFVPPEVRPIVEEEVATAEHRTVTVSFVKVPGTDAFADQEDSAPLVQLLERVERAADRAVDEFGVCWSATDIAPDGFKLLFFAGAPVALEDDAGRVLRTALTLADECGDLRLQIGVNTGMAFAADVGHPRRRTFAIIGDTVNLAARLMSKASSRPLVSPTTVAAARSAWTVGPPKTFHVKGKQFAVTAHDLLDEEHRSRPGVQGPLIGRSAAWQQLTRRLGATGRGAAFELVGPDGIGKSHLVGAVALDATKMGVPCIMAQGTPLRSRTAYAALSGSFHELDHHPAATRMSIDDLVARRDRLHADIVSRLTAEAVPTLLVVEDTRWLDDASQSFLAQVTAATDQLPWTVITTRRSDGPRSEMATPVELDGLTLTELLQIATPSDGSGWLPHDLEVLAESVAGNPLFFSEALRLPRGPDTITTGSRAVELLTERLDQLSPAQRRAVRALATVGRPLPLDLWAEIAEQPLDRVSELGVSGVLTKRSDGWWFSSEPMVAIAEGGLARRDRRRVHARAAEVLERHADELSVSSAELAVHHAAAEHGAAAWRWSRIAASAALEAGALRQAAELLRLAVHASGSAPDDGEVEAVVLQLGALEVALGRFDDADRVLRDVWKRRGTAAPVGATLGRARAAEQAGRFVAASRLLRRVERDPRRTERDHIDALLLSGLVAQRRGRPRTAVADCWRAVHESHRLADDRRRAQGHLQLEMIRWAAGHRHATMHERCAEVLFRRSHDAKGLGYLLMNRGVNRLNEGPWDAALADCDEASRMLEGAGYLIDAAIADMNAGVVLVRQGRTAEMLRRSVAIERTFRGLGWEEGIAYLDIGIAAAHGQRRELSEALTRLAHAEQVFMETHNVEFLGETRRQRALCQLYHGHHEEALTDLTAIDPAWFEADPVLEVSVSWLGGHAALQRGELARADVLLHRAADLAEARRLPFERARVAWSLEGWAEVASSDEGPRWREVRLDTFRKLDVTDALPALPIH